MIDQAGEYTRASIPWGWNLSPGNVNYTVSLRDMLGCEPQDILIEGGFLHDKLMLNDPIAWVKLMLEKHTNKQESEK